MINYNDSTRLEYVIYTGQVPKNM